MAMTSTRSAGAPPLLPRASSRTRSAGTPDPMSAAATDCARASAMRRGGRGIVVTGGRRGEGANDISRARAVALGEVPQHRVFGGRQVALLHEEGQGQTVGAGRQRARSRLHRGRLGGGRRRRRFRQPWRDGRGRRYRAGERERRGRCRGDGWLRRRRGLRRDAGQSGRRRRQRRGRRQANAGRLAKDGPRWAGCSITRGPAGAGGASGDGARFRVVARPLRAGEMMRPAVMAVDRRRVTGGGRWLGQGRAAETVQCVEIDRDLRRDRHRCGRRSG